MKNTELRIGNLVSTERGTVKIEHFAYNEIRGFINNIGHSKRMFGFEIKDCEPIQLTEEWLIKLGFEKDYSFPFEDFMYSKLVREGDMEKEVSAITIGLSHKFEIYNGIYRQKVKSVHQLQNLYFSLVGEELEIKEG